MELRRPVKPLVPATARVRFPPSAPDTAGLGPTDLARSFRKWEHGVTGNMLVSKTSDGGSTPPAPASNRSRRVRIMVLHRSRKPAGSSLESSTLSPSAIVVLFGRRRLTVWQRFAKSPGKSLCRFDSCRLRQMLVSRSLLEAGSNTAFSAHLRVLRGGGPF